MQVFDIRGLILSLLLFIGGCLSVEPSAAVNILAPKSVTNERPLEENSVLIKIGRAGGVRVLFIQPSIAADLLPGTNDTAAVFNQPSVQDIKNSLTALETAHGVKATANVMMWQEEGASRKDFQTVVQALREKNIYRFKLLSTPDQK